MLIVITFVALVLTLLYLGDRRSISNLDMVGVEVEGMVGNEGGSMGEPAMGAMGNATLRLERHSLQSTAGQECLVSSSYDVCQVSGRAVSLRAAELLSIHPAVFSVLPVR